MSYNSYNTQLFKIHLDKDLLILIKKAYNIKNMDNYSFTKKYLGEIDISNKLDEIKIVLYTYYLNCKGYKYLENITIKRSITILRQIIKEFNYKLTSIEKYSQKNKYTIYKIIKIKNLSQKDLHMDFE